MILHADKHLVTRSLNDVIDIFLILMEIIIQYTNDHIQFSF